MTRAIWGWALTMLVACGSNGTAANTPDSDLDSGTTTAVAATPPPVPAATSDASTSRPLELHFAFVHGVQDPERYHRAHDDLADLEKEVLARVDARKPSYEAANGVSLTVSSARLNLYTDLAGAAASPGTDDGSQSDVANNWRKRLAEKLAAAFPNGEKNIVLIGHSTGARTSMEVTADVGGPGNAVRAATWGFANRVAGVVSVHGMIDALSGYATIVDVVPFSVGCKFAKTDGWCEYAANVSGVPAADWVATYRSSLVLTSVVSDDRCGTSPWSEPSDQSLPTRAQGNPSAVGLGLHADRDGVFRPSHGIPYGEFCHSDITNTGSPRHAESVNNAATRIERWLFESAPHVVNASARAQTYETNVLEGLASSAPHTFMRSCSVDHAPLGPLDVVGNCHHPGYVDGGDHAMSPEQLVSTADGKCGGTVSWTNVHDHPHSGTVWFKSYETTSAGGLLSTLK